MLLIKGVDVSGHNPNVDFQAVKNAGYDFVIVKATEGATYTNPYHFDQVKRAQEVGLRVGLYHYGYLQASKDPVDDAVSEVRHFLPKLSQCEPYLSLPPVLDFEHGAWDKKLKGIAAMSPSECLLWINTFHEGLRKIGWNFMLYSTANVIKDKLPNWKGDAWIAQYPSMESLTLEKFNKPKEGVSAKIWQYSDKGVVDGINEPADLNVIMDKAWYRSVTASKPLDLPPVAPSVDGKILPPQMPGIQELVNVQDTISGKPKSQLHYHLDCLNDSADAIKRTIREIEKTLRSES